ncbi:hypothetical protein FH025_14040 [Listeria monocytogenes]|nr:hypothetical protein [Listeria monocytogenes]
MAERLKTPAKAIKDNLLLTNKEDVWAYYKVKPTSISFANKKKRARFMRDQQKFLEEIVDYTDFHFIMYPKDFELEERMEDLAMDFAEDTRDSAEYYAEETIHLLEAKLGKVTKYAFALGIRLKEGVFKLDDSLRENAERFLLRFTDNLVNMMGFENAAYDDKLRQYSQAQSDVESIVMAIDGEAMTEEELVYLNRFNFIRGIAHHPKEESFHKKISAINNTQIDPNYPHMLELSTDIGTSYVSFVVIDEFLDNMSDMDLFYTCQRLPFPVEVNIKAQAERKSQTKTALTFKKQATKDSANEQYRAGDEVEESTELAYTMVRHLQNELKREESYLFNWLASVIVTGETPEECQERALLTKRHLQSEEIKARVPVADQLSLFYKYLQGEKLGMTDLSWIQKTLQDGIAELSFGLSEELGSKIGWLIGYIDRYDEHLSREHAVNAARDPVLYHPLIANQQIKGSKTRSIHELITGDTGGGKSYLAKMIFIYTSLLNISSLYIDPKKEMRKWFMRVINNKKIQTDYPWFIDLVQTYHFITLDAKEEENWGALDPIVFLPALEAKELSQVVMNQLYNFTGKEREQTVYLQCLAEVIERKKQGENVGSMHVIDMMTEHKEEGVRLIGELIREKISGSILKLLFHDGSTSALDLTNKRTTIIEVEGLDLPEADQSIDLYTESNWYSSAVMFALGKFCELFGRDKNKKTKVFIDEAWIFSTNAQGKRVKKSMLHVGRSYDNSMCFISQSVNEAISEEEHGNFGMFFAFDEPNNRPAVLDVLGIEQSEENLERFDDFWQGQCYFKDYYGHVGKMTVDCPFEEWGKALETVKKSAVAEAEEKYA